VDRRAARRDPKAWHRHGDYLIVVPLVPLHGHDSLRTRLAGQIERGALPASLLFHGPAGVGKQRLALWVAQRLVCEGATKPCGECQPCRYVLALQHPDVHWFFPHPNLKNANEMDLATLQSEHESLLLERATAHGLYARPDGSCGLYRYDTRLLVHLASRSPAMARRRVFLIGDAERMVPQSANPEAANAFLKFLEEPPADTTVILTSSEPGALLPTIRSRVVAVRVSPVTDVAVRALLAEPAVAAALASAPSDDLVRLAAGAPGSLIGSEDRTAAIARARTLLAAADGGAEQRLRAAFASGSARSRGAFSDVLDALTVLVHDRVRAATARGDESAARRTARLVPVIEEAKRAAEGNANPQLVTAQLLETIAGGRG
jgi:DNA polymerase-3 subunit delta'